MALADIKHTYADYVAFSELPENEGRLFELIDGEFVEKMGSHKPSKIALRIGSHFVIFLDKNPIGEVTGADGGYIIDDDNTFMPDVGYISHERMPATPEREAPVPPDLAVEVKSPTDRVRAMRRKAEKYLERGTKIVWLVFPDTQTIEVYDAARDDVKTFGIADTLDGGAVLPGFTLPVKDIFK